jgi:hypothetical protein
MRGGRTVICRKRTEPAIGSTPGFMQESVIHGLRLSFQLCSLGVNSEIGFLSASEGIRFVSGLAFPNNPFVGTQRAFRGRM